MSECNCRVSLSWVSVGPRYYCDWCGKYFDDREHPPCNINGVVKDEQESETKTELEEQKSSL